MFPETPIEFAENKIAGTIKGLREGLDPDVLAYWYKRIEDRSIEVVPEHLKDKVHFEQDRVLWMKFKMNVSKRAVPYVMNVIEEYIPMMPYSTGLYFRKVQEALTDEMNKDLC
ncbi:hypothetical protein [Nitrososphaera sp.]|uniref:hypothetical protein n=1 Tax=Nitrososphaera sp. TaxID=1971748 RepID=UPI00316DB1A5